MIKRAVYALLGDSDDDDADTYNTAAIVTKISQYAARRGYTLDASQVSVVERFQRLYSDIVELERSEFSLMSLWAKRRAIQGLYLWGGVGRGKTFLMDSFFNALPIKRKKRSHFHRFMQSVHHELKMLEGQSDPLMLIARNLAKTTQVLCLDEFHITDIGDAMLMRRLLEGLFANGVILVTTSNQRPDNLYLNGLQRSQFLPAIDLLKQQLEVVNVDAGQDYRLRTLEKAGVYHICTEEDLEQKMAAAFSAIADSTREEDTSFEIEGRAINAKRVASGIVWFEFAEICEQPRGKPDYIELARRYHTVLLSGVRKFTVDDKNSMRRFTWLIDEFYDRRVKLVICAETPVSELYADIDRDAEQERTSSRLIEMQTSDYLTQPHLS